ncbi:hypothetical protein ACQPXH_19130 [Nocardia sp. CA-135953]|uniref:hypothetical protein n=1 Tax=Nocardia sp. CA-135953 TaxID=3239978 RepID=UPI003D967671
MKATPEMTSLAMDVLEEAHALERGNLKFDAKTVGAWARCFTGQQVWPEEALEAVRVHYQQANAYPIKPGDVIAYCEAQPVWSSPEHVNHFLDTWSQFPYATVIEEHSGIRPPEFEVPDSVPREERRQYLVRELARWINDNRDALVAAILKRRHKAVEQ